MALDPRIILGLRPLASISEMQDDRARREIANQEIELRRQDIDLRRQALQQRGIGQPKPFDPVAAGHEMDYRTKQIVTVSNLLKRAKADPSSYAQVRATIGQIVPDALSHLSPDYDDAAITGMIADGDALLAKEAKAGTPQWVETMGGPDGKTPVRRAVTATEGMEIPMVPKTASTESAGSDYHQFLARYAKARNKTVDDLTDAEELDARGKFGRSDDAKATTIRMANGMTPGQAFSSERQLRNDFSRETKAAQTVAQQLALMESSLAAVKQGKAAAGSQGVLVTFQKILDPTSVVRESEYARSASGLSLLGQIEGKWDQLRQGGAGVTAADLEQFVSLARAFNKNQQAFARQTKDQIDAVAKEYGLDPSRITKDTDVQTPRAESPVAPGVTAAPVKPPTNPFRK